MPKKNLHYIINKVLFAKYKTELCSVNKVCFISGIKKGFMPKIKKLYQLENFMTDTKFFSRCTFVYAPREKNLMNRY